MKEVLVCGVNDGAWMVQLFGDIDAGNAEEFFATIAAAYDAEPHSITFDCEGLQFIDSTTLGAFVKLLKRVRGEGKAMRLSGLQPKIKKLFTICALDKIMEIDE